jgi:hypothetical protein
MSVHRNYRLPIEPFKPVSSDLVQVGARTLLLLALSVLVLSIQSCAERRAHAAPWAVAANIRPIKPTAAPGYTPPAPDIAAPDLSWDFKFPIPPRLAVTKLPTRPRVAPAQPVEPPIPAKTEAPSLAPELSESEIAAAKQQMNENLATAQKNLAAAKNHKLTAVQTDLAAKVNSFIDESAQAAKEVDWTRARNLAKKAQVLSEELVGSL